MKWNCLFYGALTALAGCAQNDGADESVIASTDEALSSGLSVPAEIAVPHGNRLAFRRSATGVQIYACAAGANGPAWVFQAPEANLYDRHGRLVGTHFAGPTWR